MISKRDEIAIVLIKNGKLTIPLFHGTSSLFVKSIIKYGLGVRNPLEDLEILPFIKRLFSLADGLIPNDEWWSINKWIIKRMMNQDPHFRHGYTFLSPSRLTAARYAINNPFGSELISFGIKLYQIICEHHPKFSFPVMIERSPVLKLIHRTHDPVLAEIPQVDLSLLKGEKGENSKQVMMNLISIPSTIDDECFEIFCQQTNFQLMRPLKPGDVKLYKIYLTEDDLKFPKYYLKQIVY